VVRRGARSLPSDGDHLVVELTIASTKPSPPTGGQRCRLRTFKFSALLLRHRRGPGEQFWWWSVIRLPRRCSSVTSVARASNAAGGAAREVILHGGCVER